MEIAYGKRTTIVQMPNGDERQTLESFFDGVLKTTKTGYSISVKVNDKSQVLAEILKALELITSKRCNDLVLRIEGSNGEIKKIYKEFVES
jgi:hypothetical protein